MRIRVNGIAPGPIDTPIHLTWAADMETAYRALRSATPLGMIGRPDDIARWVDYLTAPDETYVTGAILHVDAGQTLNGWSSTIAGAAGDAVSATGAGPADAVCDCCGGRQTMTIKKLINDPFDAVDEMLEGFVEAHDRIVRLAAPHVVARRVAAEAKVGLVVGGGSGHEPAFAGYVGPGLADAAALGNVFAAPAPDICLDAIRAASGGRGVVLAYGNYAGDVLNFDLAVSDAAREGIDCRTVKVTDDVASAPPAARDRRRGIAGDVFVFKIAGASAERGDDLATVERLARAANEACASIGVALSACEVPGSGRPTFDIGPDEIEIGMGVHGEPGIERGKLQPADAVVDRMIASDPDRSRVPAA